MLTQYSLVLAILIFGSENNQQQKFVKIKVCGKNVWFSNMGENTKDNVPNKKTCVKKSLKIQNEN